MKVFAPAKVNLALDVVGQQKDGYHELDMIMSPVSLYNIVDIYPSEVDSISCINGNIPNDNAMKKMVKVLKEKYPQVSNYTISIEEHIPMQAGLAGASANAAAVLKAINDIDSLQMTVEEMVVLGKQVGADVPFCVVNQMARVKGIGEKIRPISCGYTFPVLLVKPSEGVSTPEAFRLWHELEPIHPEVDVLETALKQEDFETYLQKMGNALEPAAMKLVPALAVIKQELERYRLKAMMTGSGSTMMGFGLQEDLEKARDALQNKYAFVRIVTVG